MKKLAAAAGFALALAAAPAVAGGITPVTPEVVVIEDTATSNAGILVPILFLIFAIAGASS
ncbi:MAG: hypothetical protein AAF914_10555 [Pseudomonadota bacterium]